MAALMMNAPMMIDRFIGPNERVGRIIRQLKAELFGVSNLPAPGSRGKIAEHANQHIGNASPVAIPICDGIGKPHLDAEDPVDALPIFLPAPRRLIVPSRSASPTLPPDQNAACGQFAARQWPFCMTPQDTFPSEKGYILSFPAILPDAEKQRFSLVIYL